MDTSHNGQDGHKPTHGEQEEEEEEQPTTRKPYFVTFDIKYITFLFVGLALLWPWNCFLSASAFYSSRFYASPALSSIYSPTMMSISTITSTVGSYILSQKQSGVNYRSRVQTGLSVTIVIFVVMALTSVAPLFLHMGDTVFFAILMTMVFMSALATCLAQNGTMAIVNVLGSIYANSVMVGQAVAGVLPSIALIISVILAGEQAMEVHEIKPDFGIFWYFLTSSIVCILALALFFISRDKKEASYSGLAEAMVSQHEESPEEELETQKKFVPFAVLWSKLKYIAMTIFLTFSITLSFPVFASVVQSTNAKSKVLSRVFIPSIYLIWNVGDLLGRILCGYPRLRMLITNPRTLLVYSIARLVFIPLFMTCNIHPGKADPLINSDLWYILLQLLFGVSNGQLCTSSFMVVGDFCDTDDEKEAAGGFTAVFLSVGLAVGSVLSYLLLLVVN
ncbi:uncharacterized protein LODBEIA_P49370 [Lodderomyces beijingensis]|uniref:Nucleoside transporter FUN26 n=1 Tax=Lodderomyces beijingensis TaxID=1775926 RepID=A0ABP0ZSQ0_9ASCO